MTELKIDVELEGITSAYVEEAPFDKGLAVLSLNSYRLISLEENALLRILKGKNAEISKSGNWIKESFVYVPQKGVYLVKDSPILWDPKQAVRRSRKNEESYIRTEHIDKVLEDSVRVPFDLKSVPTNRFSDEEITVYAFGKQAKSYGKFLKEAGIQEMPLELLSKEYVSDRFCAIIRQLWFYNLSCRSGFVSNNMSGISCNGRARGICGDITEIKEQTTFVNPFEDKETEDKQETKPIYINPFEIDLGDEE